jgi:hypothetical protein
MTHHEKVANFRQLLRERGYWRSNAIPPAFQLLWLLGFETPPPYFLPFWTGVVVAGVPFGFFMGVFNYFFNYFISAPFIVTLSAGSLVSAMSTSVFFGLPFGLLMAMFWRRKSQKLQLPDWDNFPVRRN